MDLLMNFLGMCSDLPGSPMNFLGISYIFPQNSSGFTKDSLRISLSLLKDFLGTPCGRPLNFQWVSQCSYIMSESLWIHYGCPL